MTTTIDPAVADYLRRVRAALADLPTDTREELLEEEPAHLADVLAENSDGLEDRLGQPEAYAAELRAAAGLPPATGAARAPAVALDLLRRGRVALARVDRAGGSLVGYDRLADLLLLLRPGWWVLRGYLVGLLLLRATGGERMSRLLPVDMGDLDALVWLTAVGACVVASVRLGRLTPRFAPWGRWALGASAALIVLLALGNVGSYVEPYGGAGMTVIERDPFDGVSDIYPYDKQMRPLDGVQLFDQNGNPVQIGDYWRCHADMPDPSVQVNPFTYPLCPPAPWLPDAGGGPQATPAPGSSPEVGGSTPGPSGPPASPGPSGAPASPGS
jgi:hypothetical protein